MIYIPRPSMTDTDPARQLVQMRSYLFQLSEQLEYAFQNIDKNGNSGGVVQTYVQKSNSTVKQKTPAETFSELKSLIIKSADIVNAYCDKINAKLEGLYASKSEFGDYVESTKLELEATSKGISQNYTDIQGLQLRVDGVQGNLDTAVQNIQTGIDALQTNVDDLNTAILETNAYIKTGKIADGENGVPIYGLEIGQMNTVNGEPVFDKFARFSADRLSFFDSNDTEVAYISDYKLYITNAEITGSLQIVGRFKIFYANGLAFQWMGGNG